MPVSIVVVDSHRLVRQGLIALLESKSDISVVGEADSGPSAVELVKKLNPDVMITEINLPGLNGIDVARNIHSALPDIKIVALSARVEERFVVEMLKAGASAFLTKHCSIDELHQAIKIVCDGQTYLSPTITGNVLKHFFDQSTGKLQPNGSVLSGREREVLQRVAEGNSSKQIAILLHVSHNTVIRHRQHITDKLGINGVAELTRYAIREGLLEP